MHSDTALTNFEEKHIGWERTQEAHTTHLNWMLRTGASVKSDIHSMLTTCCTCAPPSTVGSTGLVCRFRCECIKESRQTGRVGPVQPAHHRRQQGPSHINLPTSKVNQGPELLPACPSIIQQVPLAQTTHSHRYLASPFPSKTLEFVHRPHTVLSTAEPSSELHVVSRSHAC